MNIMSAVIDCISVVMSGLSSSLNGLTVEKARMKKLGAPQRITGEGTEKLNLLSITWETNGLNGNSCLDLHNYGTRLSCSGMSIMDS